jgi:hypothetical protein
VSCVRWCPAHIVLCFLFSLSSSCVRWFPTHIVLGFCILFVFVLCLGYPMLPVSLDCPFQIAPSILSNVY